MNANVLRGLFALIAVLVSPLLDAQEDFHIGNPVRDIAADSGRLYWVEDNFGSCPGGELAPPCQIRRKSFHGFSSNIRYQAATQNNSIESNIAVDGQDVYFLGNFSVLRRYIYDSLSTVSIVAPKAGTGNGEVAVDDTHIWWIEGDTLYRALKTGGSRQTMYENAIVGTMSQLKIDAEGSVWFIADALFAPAAIFRFNGPGDVVIGPAYTNTYALDDTHVYMAVGESTGNRTLRRASLGDLGGHVGGREIHNAGDSTPPNVVTMAISGNDLYYYKDVQNGSQEAVYRLAKANWASGAGPVAVTTAISNILDFVASEEHLYYRRLGSGTISRLTLAGLAPIGADAAITELEVVQAVQNLNNTVGLTDKKMTTVRVYPQVSDVSGVPGVNVTVTLTGTRDGLPLTYPPAPQSRYLGNMTSDRRDVNSTFNFVLPSAWRSGTINLQASIGISGIADTDVSNNTFIEPNVVFQPKAPICVKFLPVLNTANLNYRVRNLATGDYNPAWLEMYNRFLTNWPSPEVYFYTQTTSLRKPAFLSVPGPFNMEDGADKDFIMAALWEHNVWDNAPGWCEKDNARTHYYAMVPSGISGGPGGMARLGEPLFYVKMFTGGATNFDQPMSGPITMQEIVHTYNNLIGDDENYQHVNCGLPTGGDFNAFYPYDPNSIGLNGGVLNASAGWGYDQLTGTVIPPDQVFLPPEFIGGDQLGYAVDYMSYCGPAWTSDYSWTRMINHIPDRPPNASKRNKAAPVSDVLMVNGIIDHHEEIGEIITAFHVPPGLEVEPTASQGAGEFGATGSYVLNLRNSSGTIIATHPVLPTHTEDHTDDHESFYFHVTVPWVAGTASFDVVKDSSLSVATAAVSPNPPSVTIGNPGNGDTLLAPLTIDWTASDPDGDVLNYIVQYSADGGTTWNALVTRYESNTLVLDDTSEMSQSADAYIRVIASDGINMSFDTVGPLTVPNHAPNASILLPAASRSYLAGETVTLEGLGMDFDEGQLPGENLTWSVEPVFQGLSFTGSGQTLSLAGLAPRRYLATLTATDSEGLTGTATIPFTVATRHVPDGSTPTMDGRCTDPGYTADGEPVSLRYDNESPSVARMIRGGSDLYVCISGMPLLTGLATAEYVYMAIDPDASWDSAPDAGDMLIRISRAGVLAVFEGIDGSYVGKSATGIDVNLAQDPTGTWSAEFSVDTGLLGGWNHLGSIALFHAANGITGEWPQDVSIVAPFQWGQVSFGTAGQNINFTQPPDIMVGDAPLALIASATSGLTVQLTSLTPSVCSIISNAYVTGVAGGTCTIEATQPGSAAYLPASPVSRSFNVVPGDINIGEPNNTFAQATPITGACPQLQLTRQLNPSGDVDFYSFNGPADLPVSVDIDAAINGGTLNSVLGVFDKNGNLVTVNDDATAPGETASADSYLRFNMPASGEVTIAVAGFDDFDFDGVGSQGTSTGTYEIDVRCSPEPGQLLGTTGAAQNLLLDIDPATGEAVTRAALGAFGSVTDIAFCQGRLWGAIGGGNSILTTIDPVSGTEQYACDIPGDSMPALACIDNKLHGAWNATFPDQASDLVRIGAPSLQPAGSIVLLNETVEQTAPPSFTFNAVSTAVVTVKMDIDFDTVGFAWGSDFYFVITHLPTDTVVRIGTEGASCQAFDGCDIDLGWPNASGNFATSVELPVFINNGGGQWQVDIKTLYNNAGSEEALINNAEFVVAGSVCDLQVMFDLGDRVPGLSWNDDSEKLSGCTNSGVLLEIDPFTNEVSNLPAGDVDNCRALDFSNDPIPTLFGGSGANGTNTPGLLYTYHTGSGATNPIGQNFALSLSGIAFTPPDADRDGVYDSVDNCLGFANPAQLDTDADGFGNQCDPDIAPAINDCSVNFLDLTAMKNAFFSTPASATWNPDADLNGDNSVNFLDLTRMKSKFFGPPGPSGLTPVCTPCSQADTGLDHSESFGKELFLRGSFNDWSAPPTAKLINQATNSGLYKVKMQLDAGSYSYKMASADWSIEYDEPPTTTHEGFVIEYAGGAADNSENIELTVAAPGCYLFEIQATGVLPTPSVILETNRVP